MSRSIPRPSPAMVVACIAMVVALSGAAVAAGLTVPVDSVGTAQLKTNAVVSSKVRNGSLLALDFAPNQLPPGPRGDSGSPGVSGYQLVTGRNETPDSSFNSLIVSCPTGKKAVGGGGGTAGGIVVGDGPYLTDSQPTADDSGWYIATARGTSGRSVLLGYAICANVS